MTTVDSHALLAARLYAAVHTGNAGDVQFYRDVCAGGGPVLELGCGAGRVACSLLADGLTVTGLDNDPAALALARAAGLSCIEGSMADFGLDLKFDHIIIPYNGLFCLLDEAAMVACLRCAAKHLAPRGELVFDGYVVDLDPHDISNAPIATAPEFVTTVSVDGERWDVYEESTLWPRKQRVDATYIHTARRSGQEIRTPIRQRYLYAEELPTVLALAGLKMVALQGGFLHEAYSASSAHFVARASH